MTMSNFWERFSKAAAETISENSGLFLSGLASLGLALLCKKLDIPLDSFNDTMHYDRPPRRNQNRNIKPSNSYIIPRNAMESAISAIYTSANNAYTDSARKEFANEIFNMLKENRNSLDESTKIYTISIIQKIATACYSDSYKRDITKIISSIGKGNF